MITSWHSYPKIYNLGHHYLLNLLEDEVLIEEKIDGSQFSFGKFDNELKIRSKGVELNIDTPEKMFSLAVDTVKKISPKLKDGWTYRAEYLRIPKHNSLAYDRVPTNHLIIFDINPSEEAYLDYETKVTESAAIDLECVPMIYKGKISSSEEILKFMETISILGGQKIEGLVIKNYKKFGDDKKALMGKYVSEEFKEVHKHSWKESNPGKQDVIETLGAKYKNISRWNKAVQHLKESGEITDTPKDIGSILKEAMQDIENECQDEIKKLLYDWAIPNIKRISVSGLPEWYKQELLKKQFEKEK